MFITRFTFEQHQELARLREQNTQLTAQLAAARTSNDWLSSRVTSLEFERAALTERLLQVSYPVPVIERTNERPAGTVPGVFGRPVEDGYVIPEHLKGSMVPHPKMAPPDPPAAPRRPAMSAEEEMANSISALQASNTTFEDMGDAAAAEQGIAHDDAGNVVYKS
jgi:hypothetical protein